MKSLIYNIRFYVLLGTLLVSLSIFLFVSENIHQGILQIIRLQELFAFTSIVYLYFTLLAGPFTYTFTSFPWKKEYLKARRALGVGAFYFALLHSLISFLGMLGGFGGIGFLGGNYLLALSLGLAALVIMFFLTITSFDFAVRKMHFSNWKLLHRLVYIAGFSILIHAVILGTHFADLSQIIPQIIYIATGILILLESQRMEVFLQRFFPFPSHILPLLISLLFFTFYILINFIAFSPENKISFSIHAHHIQVLKQKNSTK